MGCHAIVKIPLDVICVKTGVLCSKCQRKVDSGEVDKHEIEIMKKLIELEEQGLRELKEAQYFKSVMQGNYLIILIRLPADSEELTKKISKELSEATGLRVKVIEHSRDLRKIVARILAPARVLGVNKVWLPDGTQIYAVRVLKSDEKLLSQDRQTLEELLHAVTGEFFSIKFE